MQKYSDFASKLGIRQNDTSARALGKRFNSSISITP